MTRSSTGSYRRSDLAGAAPAPGHAGSREVEGFGYLDHLIDAESRVAVIAGTVNERSGSVTARADPREAILDRHDHYGILA